VAKISFGPCGHAKLLGELMKQGDILTEHSLARLVLPRTINSAAVQHA
jgi:hypothetical protein